MLTFRALKKTIYSYPGIQVSSCAFCRKNGMSLYHILVPRKENPKVLNRGSGASFSPKLAFRKAWSEFVERDVFLSIVKKVGQDTSNGFAAHSDEKLAYQNSIFELIERDVFLTSWLANKKAKTIRIAKTFRNFSVISKLQTLKRLGISAKFGTFGTVNGIEVGVSTIEGPRGISLATAANHNRKDLLAKLVEEALKQAFSWHLDKRIQYTEALDASDLVFSHMTMYFNTFPENPLRNLIQDGAEIFHEKDGPSIETQDVTSVSRYAQDTQLFVKYSRSDDLQKLWFGPTVEKKVNFERLKKRFGSEVTFADINTLPHPLA